MNGSLLQTLRELFALLKRWPAWLVMVVLTAQAATLRAWLTGIDRDSIGSGSLALIHLTGGIAPAIVLALIALFLARTMLSRDTGDGRILWGRWLGLFLLHFLFNSVLTAAITFAIFATSSAPFAITYGTVAAGGLVQIALFPILVSGVLAAAGAREPRFGPAFVALSGPARYAFFWYAVCELLFPALGVFAYLNLLGPGDVANELPGNLVQSVIGSIGSLLQLLLAIIAARMMLPPASYLGEIFD